MINKRLFIRTGVLFSTLLGLLSLENCASLSQAECQTGNWSAIGQRDGERGYSSSRISRHAEACAEFGVKPNVVEYDAGYDRGLISYCGSKGYDHGKKGTYSLPGLCQKDHHENAYLERLEYSLNNNFCTYNKGKEHASSGNFSKGEICPDASVGHYKEGYRAGRRHYCSPSNAYELGYGNRKHNVDICTNSQAKSFLKAYYRGERAREKAAQLEQKRKLVEAQSNLLVTGYTTTPTKTKIIVKEKRVKPVKVVKKVKRAKKVVKKKRVSKKAPKKVAKKKVRKSAKKIVKSVKKKQALEDKKELAKNKKQKKRLNKKIKKEDKKINKEIKKALNAR